MYIGDLVTSLHRHDGAASNKVPLRVLPAFPNARESKCRIAREGNAEGLLRLFSLTFFPFVKTVCRY